MTKAPKKEKTKAGKKLPPVKKKPTVYSASESEIDSDAEEEIVPKPKPKAKGRPPKTKAESKVVKKKPTKATADLTKPPPKAKASTSAKGKTAAKPKAKPQPKEEDKVNSDAELYDNILNSDAESAPAQPTGATKTAKKTKIIHKPMNGFDGAESSGQEEEAQKIKTKSPPKSKNKGKAVKKKAIPKPAELDNKSMELPLESDPEF